MCGIVGTIGAKNTLQTAVEALQRLEYRGYDSFGVSVLADDGITTKKSIGSVTEHASKQYFKDLREGGSAIAHTRWATHGGVTNENAHPHVSMDGAFSLVHNGVIDNYRELRRKLEKEGVKFSSETDTEIIVQLLGRHFKKTKNILEALQTTLDEVTGEYAIVFMTTHDPAALYGARQKSPLGFGMGKGLAMFASDQMAIGPITQEMTFLEDGDVVRLTPDRTDIYAYKKGTKTLKKVSRKPTTIPWKDDSDKAGYDHYMLKEIMESPVSVEYALQKDIPAIKQFIKRLPKQTLNLTGAGSAFYAAMIGQYFFADLAKTYVRTHPSDEFLALAKLGKKDHLFAMSQSGETFDTLEVVKDAQKDGAEVTAINNVVGSSMQRIADNTIIQGSGREICVLSTKSVTSQTLILYRIAKMLGIEKKVITPKMAKQLAADEQQLIPLLEVLFKKTQKEIEKVARATSDAQNWFFIGRGAHYPVAMEGALKYKEVSYLHAEGMPAGFFKHGTISLVDEKLHTVAFLPSKKLEPEVYSLTVSNLMEIKARGGKVIAFGHDEDISGDISGLTAYIQLPSINRHLDVIFELVAGQFLAYYCALELGRPIDKPRALAKAVTVR